MKVAVLATAAVLLGTIGAQAQVQRFNEDYNLGHESGPPVLGGNGATSGPNAKNVATSPMPGSLEISERPRDALIAPLPEQPIVVPRPAPKPQARAQR